MWFGGSGSGRGVVCGGRGGGSWWLWLVWKMVCVLFVGGCCVFFFWGVVFVFVWVICWGGVFWRGTDPSHSLSPAFYLGVAEENIVPPLVGVLFIRSFC